MANSHSATIPLARFLGGTVGGGLAGGFWVVLGGAGVRVLVGVRQVGAGKK